MEDGNSGESSSLVLSEYYHLVGDIWSPWRMQYLEGGQEEYHCAVDMESSKPALTTYINVSGLIVVQQH